MAIKSSNGESELRIVRIEWVDAAQEFEVDADDVDNLPEGEICTTVGYLIRETKNFIFLAQEQLQSRKFRAVSCIPKSLIIGKPTTLVLSD